MIQKSIERGDELVKSCVDEASEYLSGGIASIINFINPKLIVLGGGLIEAVDYFYQTTIKKLKQNHCRCLPAKFSLKKQLLETFQG